LFYILLAAPPSLINTLHLLHVYPINHSYTLIFCFSLSPFLNKLFPFIYLFVYLFIYFYYYYLFIFVIYLSLIFFFSRKIKYLKIIKNYKKIKNPKNEKMFFLLYCVCPVARTV